MLRCPHCDSENFQEHGVIHTGKSQYQCNVCQKTFVNGEDKDDFEKWNIFFRFISIDSAKRWVAELKCLRLCMSTTSGHADVMAYYQAQLNLKNKQQFMALMHALKIDKAIPEDIETYKTNEYGIKYREKFELEAAHYIREGKSYSDYYESIMPGLELYKNPKSLYLRLIFLGSNYNIVKYRKDLFAQANVNSFLKKIWNLSWDIFYLFARGLFLIRLYRKILSEKFSNEKDRFHFELKLENEWDLLMTIPIYKGFSMATEQDFLRAKHLDELLKPFYEYVIDPPIGNIRCISPAFYPEFWPEPSKPK